MREILDVKISSASTTTSSTKTFPKRNCILTVERFHVVPTRKHEINKFKHFFVFSACANLYARDFAYCFKTFIREKVFNYCADSS